MAGRAFSFFDLSLIASAASSTSVGRKTGAVVTHDAHGELEAPYRVKRLEYSKSLNHLNTQTSLA